VSVSEHYLKTELYDLIQRDTATLDLLLQGSLDGIWYQDIESPENTWLSPEFWSALGYDSADMPDIESRWQDLIYPEDLAAARDNLARH